MPRTQTAILVAALTALFSSARALAAEKPRVVVLGVVASDSRLKLLGNSIAEQVLTELSRSARLEVIGASDVATALGMERQRQLLGCATGSNACLVEISQAMGAPWLVTGSLARAGRATRVDLKLIRAADGKALYRGGKSFQDQSQMFDVISSMVKELVEAMNLAEPHSSLTATAAPSQATPAAAPQTGVRTPAPAQTPTAVASPTMVVTPAPAQASPSVAPPTVVVTPAPSRAPRLAPWLVAGGGAAMAVLGGGLVIKAAVDGAAGARPRAAAGKTAQQVADEQRAANTTAVVGATVGGVGLAALCGGLVWLAVGNPVSAPTTVSVSVSNTGATLLVGGTF